MSLRSKVENAPDADLPRKMLRLAAERPIGMTVEALTGAGYRDKRPERVAEFNGIHDGVRASGAGTVDPRITKLNKGRDFPRLRQSRSRSEQALTAVIHGDPRSRGRWRLDAIHR